MGKGTRSRNSRAGEIIADPAKFNKRSEADKSKLMTRLGIIACAALLVVCVALWAFTTWVPRVSTAVRSNNFKLNGSEMTYIINDTKNSYVNTLSAYNLLSTYGISDTTLEGLKSQTCYFDTTMSWFEYFADLGKSSAENILVLCEAAKAEGVSLDDDEKQQIADTIKANREAAEEYAIQYALQGYTTSYVLTQQYGTGVSESNVRSVLELQALAQKYLNIYKERVTNSITSDELAEYLAQNPDKLLSADILSYDFVAELEIEGPEATDEENAAYETAKENAKKLAEELAACTSREDFVAKAVEYITTTYATEQYESLYESNMKDEVAETVSGLDRETNKTALIESVAAKVKGEADEIKSFGTDDDYSTAMDKIGSSLLTAVQSAYDDLQDTTAASYADPTAEDATDSEKWLFADERKAGDSTSIASEGEKKSTYTAYFVVNTAHRDDTVTKDVGHILFATDTYGTIEDAKAKAEEILAQYNEGEKTKEAFETLANEWTEDSSVFYTNVAKNYMEQNFEDWIYDESRTVGEVDIIETSYGAHIMYFVGDGETAWEATARDGVYSDKYTEWYNTQKEVADISYNNGVINSIG